jgi:C1A family cysteine protease
MAQPVKRSRLLLVVVPVITCLILLVIIGTVPVGAQGPGESPQRAPLDPDFLDYIRDPPADFYGYIPSPVDMGHLQAIPVRKPETLALLTYDPAFDWRTSGKVTPVKDQNPCGTCWIFGTLAALESKVLIGESNTFDFSEQNVACCTDASWVYLAGDRCAGGGWSWLAADTLSKKGTRLEACDPYHTTTIDTDTCDDSCTTTKYVTGYRQIALTTEAIKDAVYTHGPVSVAMYWGSSYYNSDTDIYYYTGTSSPNHLVCIVGWDDTIAHPEGGGSGVWIVKNSWGTDWGGTCGYGSERGYFYLCYGSGNMEEAAYYEYKDHNASEKIYYWDESGWVSSAGYGNDYAWMANIFTMTGSGSLTHVDFWTTSNNADYEINIYQDSNPADGLPSPLGSQTGSCEEAGYYSIALDSPVSVSNGQIYTVAVKMTTTGYNYPVPIEYEWTVNPPPTTMCSPPIQTGVSYMSPDGTTWTDIGTTDSWNTSLRARVLEATVSVNVLPSTVAYGVVAPGTSQDTVTLNQHITVTNNGGVTSNFSIKSSDATRDGGTTWELVTGTPGTDEFKHEFSTNGTDWASMPANNDYTALAASIEPYGSVTVYLRITMPGSTIDSLEHTITVTIMAIASG